MEEQQISPAAREDPRHRSGHASMPGAFGDDTPDSSPVQKQPEPPRGLFSGITKRLGLDSGGEASRQLQNLLGNNQQGSQQEQQKSLPPSYDESTSSPQPQSQRPGQEETATAPHQLHQNLVNAIEASRAHDSSTLFSSPRQNTVKEQSTYCDSEQGHNIVYLASTSNGVRIFNSKDLSIRPTIFLSSNVNALNAFAVLLFDVCDIYNIKRNAMHIYYDERGSTIAFNQAGAVFCNYRYFDQLHSKVMATPQGKVEATSWWWVVIAHEVCF